MTEARRKRRHQGSELSIRRLTALGTELDPTPLARAVLAASLNTALFVGVRL
jgi:hypothetical protein